MTYFRRGTSISFLSILTNTVSTWLNIWLIFNGELPLAFFQFWLKLWAPDSTWLIFHCELPFALSLNIKSLIYSVELAHMARYSFTSKQLGKHKLYVWSHAHNISQNQNRANRRFTLKCTSLRLNFQNQKF